MLKLLKACIRAWRESAWMPRPLNERLMDDWIRRYGTVDLSAEEGLHTLID